MADDKKSNDQDISIEAESDTSSPAMVEDKNDDEELNKNSAEADAASAGDEKPPVLEEGSTQVNVDSGSSSTEESAITSKAKEKKSGKRIPLWFWALIFVFLLLFAAFAASLFFVRSGFKSELARLESQRESFQENYIIASEFESSMRDIRMALDDLHTDMASQKAQLRQLEQGAKAFNRRLLAMSTTSRDDWQLAEAEYLLKLANQRVLIERKPDTAIGLLEEADAILRDLANFDLLPLRKAIKDDLLALKLSEKVDREGIYLELSTLAERVESLPLVPQHYQASIEETMDDGKPAGKEKSIMSSFIESFSNYVRVIDHSDKPEAILPPDETAYLHMNLRFMLERAQIALLREQQAIYEKNLSQAIFWIKSYFSTSPKAKAYERSLVALKEKNISINLPDISHSLELLHDYIDTLHQLGETGQSSEDAPTSVSAEAKL